MNRKRYRECDNYNNDNAKKYKNEAYDAKDRTYNITTRNMALIVLDRINILEKSLNEANAEIIKLIQQNNQYTQRLNEIYNYTGLPLVNVYKHSESYIS